MKKIYKYALALSVCVSGALFTGCKDEVLVPVEDNTTADSLSQKILEKQGMLITINNELNTITVENKRLQDSIGATILDPDEGFNPEQAREVQYTVNVMSFGTASFGQDWARTTGVSGATVIFQQNGMEQTVTTDDGLAIAKIKQGYVNVIVTAENHAEVEFTAFVGYDDKWSDGMERNASTQIFLYPIAGPTTATIWGNAYINNSTLDDTLSGEAWWNMRVYSDAAPSNLMGKYIAQPGPFRAEYNYTQYNDDIEVGTIYNDDNRSWAGRTVQFDKAPVGYRIFATPDPNELYPNNLGEGDHGWITSITWKGLIFSAAVEEDGTYSLTVPAAVDELNIELEGDPSGYVGPHKRLTENNGSYEEIGSSKVTFRNYDINSATSSDDERWVIEEDWEYGVYFQGSESYFDNNDFNVSNDGGGDDDSDLWATPGRTYRVDAFLFPIERVEDWND